jgi:hypothetical protein
MLAYGVETLRHFAFTFLASLHQALLISSWLRTSTSIAMQTILSRLYRFYASRATHYMNAMASCKHSAG